MILKNEISNYLHFCKNNKNLTPKTLKAYKIDLTQMLSYFSLHENQFNKDFLIKYISELNTFKPKTVKRKIASLKAFCSYLECEDILEYNPFHKIKMKFKEPVILPKTISLENIKILFKYLYTSLNELDSKTPAYFNLLRDIVAIELLFCTGGRISEICSLKKNDINMCELFVKFFGKGSKERLVYITNPDVVKIVQYYLSLINTIDSDYLFTNRFGNRLSEQSLRFSIYKYIKNANITEKVTPHMFRHSFATMLLDDNVDIRCIQNILGHSSITTTQIYTHVSMAKQKEVLIHNNPRNKI